MMFENWDGCAVAEAEAVLAVRSLDPELVAAERLAAGDRRRMRQA